MNIITLRLQEKDGKRWLLIQLLLPSWNRRKWERGITSTLVVVTAGLVILLARQLWPPLGIALVRLLSQLLGAP